MKLVGPTSFGKVLSAIRLWLGPLMAVGHAFSIQLLTKNSRGRQTARKSPTRYSLEKVETGICGLACEAHRLLLKALMGHTTKLFLKNLVSSWYWIGRLMVSGCY